MIVCPVCGHVLRVLSDGGLSGEMEDRLLRMILSLHAWKHTLEAH